ncbi:single-stranded DNA-binding protein [Microbacterium sp. 179-B 1A2 NHS]|uniref:single-stranded DNA-binding protein n=1 Tax=Microbacterium sp. 179-B 1A2 NHS TaxID=3142383 RepID=UPI0039A39B6D
MKDLITIVGRVGGDPQLRRTHDGGTIASFSVATSDRTRDPETGAWADGPTSWYDVSAFRTLGDNVLASVRKGDRVIVAGRLTIRKWQSGERSGISADIDAGAVGHDLLFGSTAFTKTAGRREQPSGPVEGEASERELVGAGGSGSPEWRPEPGETPF